MKKLNMEEIALVSGSGAGDIEVEIGTGGVGVKGSLSDFADLAVQYSRFAPFSGLGMAGLFIRMMNK